MENTRIAIPSCLPGGLEAELGHHFGHCDLYTLVDWADGKVSKVSTLAAIPHEQGGCMGPVNHLAQNGVKVLIAGGMGMRPLMGFNQVGIKVYLGGGTGPVGQLVEWLAEGKLQEFTVNDTCGGGAQHANP
jgi:predicted Fe-Mo cluster-binding NifX family protein